MAGLGCSIQESWEILVEVSQHSNIRVRLLADMITASATDAEPLPQSVRDHLAAAVACRPHLRRESWMMG
ncbi:hypothetical protein AB0911_36590 [Streptomyces nigra]|uniref:hypothetical protein n=1 Tax=Streptomyces nigra TaxID=1827580 RepID=UPI0034550B63